MKNEVTVYAPATVANLVCGFDILGMALDAPRDKFVIRKTNKRGVTIINKDDFNLPDAPEKNVSGKALLAMLDELNDETGFEIESHKSIKPGSGIGSSAASAAGAVVGANYLLNEKFSKEDLVRFALCGEEIASGSKHADNIAPCIYGGVMLIRSHTPLDVIAIKSPPLFVTVIHPQIEVKTSDARQILKKNVAMKDAIAQWANVAGLIAGLMKSDYSLIARSLNDVIVEPVRSILIPAFDELKKKSLEAGALGGGISGSGPSVFMLSKDEATAKKVEETMHRVYSKTGVQYHTYVTNVNHRGVEIEK
jgi:homoserine kinase